MKTSYLLNLENIEDIHFINNDIAKKLCSLLDIDLDIYYDKYSNMESTYKICDKYNYNYSYAEKFHGHFSLYFYDENRPKKTIIMKSDNKNYLYSPVFFHELGHALEGYFFYDSKKNSLDFAKLKKNLFSFLLEERDIQTEVTEGTEYIANILGLLLTAKIDHLSEETNYLYSYYNYYRSINSKDTTLSDIVFISFFMNDDSINMIKKATPFLSYFDYEYIEFLEATLQGLYDKLNLDFSYYQDFFDKKIAIYKETKTSCIEDAIINSFKVF